MPTLKAFADGKDQVTGEKLLKVRLYPELHREARPITLPIGGGVKDNNAEFGFGYLHETGIYSASLAYTGSATKLYDVWSDLSNNELFTGSSIGVKSHVPLPYSNADEEYIAAISNLKPSYRTTDNPTLRVSFRKKGYQPNIYTVATNKTQNEVLYDVYYRAYRLVDSQDVVTFGSGSTPYTKTSYDSSGSFFKLEMSLFEPGYMYGLEIATDEFGRNITNKDVFKFRVE